MGRAELNLVTEYPAQGVQILPSDINKAIKVYFKCYSHTPEGCVILEYRDVEHGTFTKKAIDHEVGVARSCVSHFRYRPSGGVCELKNFNQYRPTG